MQQVKERPILFSAPMVRAILEGRKTQTRRVCEKAFYYSKYTRKALGYDVADVVHPDGSGNGWIAWFGPSPPTKGKTAELYPGEDGFKCPHGQTGDRLWVRENFRIALCGGHHYNNGPVRESFETFSIEYAADNSEIELHFLNGLPTEETAQNVDYAMAYRMADTGHGGFRPSIHMPRWASRIALEITGTRVERLQDISEHDAMAEGATWTDNGPRMWAKDRGLTFQQANPVNGWNEGWSHEGETVKERCLQTAKTSFGHLWQSINGQESWDQNPWVWVIEFRQAV